MNIFLAELRILLLNLNLDFWDFFVLYIITSSGETFREWFWDITLYFRPLVFVVTAMVWETLLFFEI